MFALHVGSAGCHVGDQFWRLACREDGLDESGSATSSRGCRDVRSLLWTVVRAERAVPRCIFVDSDGDTIDRISRGWLL